MLLESDNQGLAQNSVLLELDKPDETRGNCSHGGSESKDPPPMPIVTHKMFMDITITCAEPFLQSQEFKESLLGAQINWGGQRGDQTVYHVG
jgi:hypothetical protein